METLCRAHCLVALGHQWGYIFVVHVKLQDIRDIVIEASEYSLMAGKKYTSTK